MELEFRYLVNNVLCGSMHIKNVGEWEGNDSGMVGVDCNMNEGC